MKKRTDDRPRHIQIAADLRSKILAGDLTESLPSFSQLMATYNTASSTAQRAVGLLKAEGFVEGQHGKGLVVLPKRFEVIDALSPVDASASNVAYKTLRVGRERPPADAARKLGLDDGDTAVLRQQLALRDQEPIEIAWSYYPASIAAGTPLERPEPIPGGPSAALALLKRPPHRIIGEFMSREPTTDEFETLDLSTGTPVMRKLRMVVDEEDLVLEVTITVTSGHLYPLRYERTVRSAP